VLPLVPVRVNVNVPFGEAEVVATWNVELPEPATEVGLNEPVVPAGIPEALNVTVPAKPPEGVTVTV